MYYLQSCKRQMCTSSLGTITGHQNLAPSLHLWLSCSGTGRNWILWKLYWKFIFHVVVVVTQSHLTLCDPMNCSTPGFPVLHHRLELAQTHAHQVSDAIQPSHPLSFPSALTFFLSQIRVFFNESGSSHHVAKVLELQLQYQSFQWIFRVDFL